MNSKSCQKTHTLYDLETKDVYVVLKHKFKGDKIEFNSFEKRDYIIFQKYKFSSHVTLADGQVKIAHVKID